MIDIHTHIGFYEFFPEFFIQGIAQSLFKSLPDSEQNDAGQHLLNRLVKASLSDKNGAHLIKQAEQAGIKQSVVLIVDFFYQKNDENSLSKIELIHSLHNSIQMEYPEKVVVFSGIDPRRGQNGLALLEKSFQEYGFKGLKLYPPCGFEIDDSCVFDYYQVCSDYNVPVLIHTGPSENTMCVSRNFPASIKKAASQFPKLTFILAHAGILYFEDGFRLAKKYSNIYVDISGFQKELNRKGYIKNKIRK